LSTRVYRGFRSSFPDLVFDRIDYMVDKDRVVQISTMTGPNKGGFMDLPPTGNRVSIPVVLIFTLKDGKIVEQQRVYDFTGMLVIAGAKETVVGFNIGANITWPLASYVGLGTLTRYSRATVTLHPGAEAGVSRAIEMNAGGLHIGGGIRLLF